MAKVSVTREEPKPQPPPAIRSVTLELSAAEALELAEVLRKADASKLVEDVRLAIALEVNGTIHFRRWYMGLPLITSCPSPSRHPFINDWLAYRGFGR